MSPLHCFRKFERALFMESRKEIVTGLFDLIEKHASVTPSRAAILMPRREPLTYGDWYGIAEDAACMLRDIGICGQDRIAVVLASGPEMIAVTAALTSVAVLAFVNPASPEYELERTLRRLGATAVVVPASGGAGARAVALRLKLTIIELHAKADAPAGMFRLSCDYSARTSVLQDTDPDIAFLALTSGTTGGSKLVAWTKTNLATPAEAFASALALNGNDRCLLMQPTFHSAAILTLAAILQAGSGVVCLAPFDPDTFVSALRSAGITWLSAPPAVYKELLVSTPALRDAARTARLRFLRAGAAPLDQDVLAQLEDVFAAPVMQLYGMTEAPFISCTPYPPPSSKTGSVGLPQRCEIAILDDSGERIENGLAGEVVVRGPNVFGGYDDPTANAEAFTDGWFRTGDLGRRDDDGYLYILGRRKDVINRGGQKIFPREIEEMFQEDRGIADVAVFGMPHATLGSDVAAAVILQSGYLRTEKDLQRFAAERIVAFKVPRRILIVREFPRTAAGKVKHHELQELLAQHRDAAVPNGKAATLLEAQILELFIDILADSGLGSEDDFFLCGGDSLRATRLLVAIRSLCGQELTIQDLFEAPTPRALAKRVVSRQPATVSPLICVQRGSKSTPLFFLNGDLDGNGAYMRRLAMALDSKRTVYSLPPHGTNGVRPLASIEAMADDYAATIRRAWPEGPYLLGGYCNGGIVAYEVARLLRAQGAQVGPVFLVGATAANAPFAAIRRTVAIVGRALRLSSDQQVLWFRRIRARVIEIAALRGTAPSVRGRHFLKKGREIVEWLGGAPLARGTPHSEAFGRMTRVLERYFPGPYDGPVHHFWAHDDVRQFADDPTMGWSRVASHLVLHAVPGDHFSMITKEFESLARTMETELASFE